MLGASVNVLFMSAISQLETLAVEL